MSLITPHGDRKPSFRPSQVRVSSSNLITPHGDRKLADIIMGKEEIHISLPLMGIVNH